MVPKLLMPPKKVSTVNAAMPRGFIIPFVLMAPLLLMPPLNVSPFSTRMPASVTETMEPLLLIPPENVRNLTTSMPSSPELIVPKLPIPPENVLIASPESPNSGALYEEGAETPNVLSISLHDRLIGLNARLYRWGGCQKDLI